MGETLSILPPQLTNCWPLPSLPPAAKLRCNDSLTVSSRLELNDPHKVSHEDLHLSCSQQQGDKLFGKYYGLSGKSCNETRLTGVQNSCRLNRRSSSWHRIEQEARLPHKLSSLLLVVE